MDSKGNSQVLKTFFVVLLVVFLGEVVFLYFNSNKKNEAIAIPTPTFRKPVPTSSVRQPVTASTDIASCVDKIKDVYFDKSQAGALDAANYYLQQGIANNGYITSELEGLITSLEKTDGKTISKNFEPGFYAKLQRKVDKKFESFELVLDERRLQKVKVKNSNGKTVSLKDLKVGQTLRINKVYDLKENTFFSYEITILD